VKMIKKVEDFVIGVAALAAVTWLVLPGRSSAKVIEAMGSSMSGVLKVAAGISDRDPAAVMLYQMLSPIDQAKAVEGLHESDRMWLDAMMSGLSE
jgi:hypothetical protein